MSDRSVAKRLPKGSATKLVQNAKEFGSACAKKSVNPCPKLAVKAASLGATVLKVESAEVVNLRMLANGRFPCWKPGTEVVTEIVPKGTQFQMVVTHNQGARLSRGESRFGGFATSEVIVSQAYARREMAILKEFKSDVSTVVTVETTVDQVIQRGVVGRIGKSKGGAQQVQFDGENSIKLVSHPTVLPTQ